MASINASTSGAGGIITTADNTGNLELQSGGSAIATVSSTGLSMATGKTFSVGGVAGSPFTMKNRIINGDMTISQRNGTTATTITNATDFFGPDRWKYYRNVGGTFTTTQSSVAPAGFVNSMLTAQYNFFQHIIEGYNAADLNWGTANAQTVTLSFWVRSSVTGTYAISIGNNAVDRTLVSTYSISAANTWEQKTITIAGDTSGTWLTDNSSGIRIYWDLGSGSDYNTATTNTWASSFKLRTSGSTTWGSTTGATFYLTGVQLEKGSSATSFEWLPYGTELQLCQRYYQKTVDIAFRIQSQAGSGSRIPSFFKVTMRATPTVVLSGSGMSNTSTYGISPDQFSINNTDVNPDIYMTYTATSEL
jgi:hypothetical protein